MIQPLEIWKSDEVTSLLKDFYESNFQKAGIPYGFGTQIIETAKLYKDQILEPELQIIINNLFLQAKTHLNTKTAEKDQLNLIDFKDVKNFVDVGANRLDTLNKIGRFYPEIEKLIGIDVIPLNGTIRYPERTSYYQISPIEKYYPAEVKDADIINFQYALHHFRNDEIIKRTLEKCRNILSKNGRIVIWEESFEEQMNSCDEIVHENNVKGFFTNSELTNRFYQLDKEKRFEFIIVNDWIININNKHMQWTGLYKTWDEWVNLFSSAGFSLKSKYNMGLRISGHVKSGVHIIGEFVNSNSA